MLIENVSLNRRELLQLAAAASASLVSPRAAVAQASPIVKPLPPEWFVSHGTNAEMRWDAAGDLGYRVPNERFFVRNHTRTPAIDPAVWRLRVFGSGVRRPLALSYRDLERLPSRCLTAAIECAGNGRSFFGSQQGTPAAGTAWRLGAIGVAEWRGVPLAEVLERAGLRRSAVDVMPEGLDDAVTDLGHVRRPLPVAKALDDVLLAYEMNGRELPPDHGFPVRLVVPGWVGIASIKWLGSLEVSDRPLRSPWNTTLYRLVGPTYPPDSPPLAEQPVKSAFELPWDAVVRAGARVTLRGRSWSGHGAIRRVEVSVDGGATWTRARLHGPNVPRAWVRWELPWTPGPGRYELLARAGGGGAMQPLAVPFNEGGYQFWAVVRHPMVLRSGVPGAGERQRRL